MNLDSQGTAATGGQIAWLHLFKAQLWSLCYIPGNSWSLYYEKETTGLSAIFLECSDFVYSDVGFFLNEKACARPQICITVIKVWLYFKRDFEC